MGYGQSLLRRPALVAAKSLSLAARFALLLLAVASLLSCLTFVGFATPNLTRSAAMLTFIASVLPPIEGTFSQFTSALRPFSNAIFLRQEEEIPGLSAGADLDFTAATDNEDLFVFVGDVAEFGLQESFLALDGLTSLLGLGGWAVGGVVTARVATWLFKRWK